MSNVNKIILLGTVTEKPEVKFGMENASSVSKLVLSVERPARADGSKENDFIPVVAFGAQADYVAEKVGAGSLLLIEGRLQVRTTENNGQKEWLTEVMALTVKSVAANSSSGSGKKSTAQPEPAMSENPFGDVTEDDVPF